MTTNETLAAEYIAAQLKARRIESLLVQQDVAVRCQFAGFPKMTQQKVAEIEAGKRRLTAGELWMFCRVLQVSPLDILPRLPDFTGGASHIPFPLDIRQGIKEAEVKSDATRSVVNLRLLLRPGGMVLVAQLILYGDGDGGDAACSWACHLRNDPPGYGLVGGHCRMMCQWYPVVLPFAPGRHFAIQLETILPA
jgi:transcriptional regulator with XRE-family HTH domain